MQVRGSRQEPAQGAYLRYVTEQATVETPKMRKTTPYFRM